MAYIQQSFKDGQTLTAEHLNHMEQGIADANAAHGSYRISLSTDGGGYIASTTPLELAKAIGEGRLPYVQMMIDEIVLTYIPMVQANVTGGVCGLARFSAINGTIIYDVQLMRVDNYSFRCTFTETTLASVVKQNLPVYDGSGEVVE